ncbi:MAG: hypothetical protein D6732_28900, partial [Methanobacteriota archaeon]
HGAGRHPASAASGSGLRQACPPRVPEEKGRVSSLPDWSIPLGVVNELVSLSEAVMLVDRGVTLPGGGYSLRKGGGGTALGSPS